MNWTNPFYGVTHCGQFGLKNKWATVEDYDSFAKLSKWFPGCGFSPIQSEHETAFLAKQEAELWLKA